MEDPLRTLMSMADDARKQVDSLVGQGARTVRGAFPELPIPGATGNNKLPAGPTEILAKLPKLPQLPGGTKEAPTPAAKPATVRRPAALARPNAFKLRDTLHPLGYQLRR